MRLFVTGFGPFLKIQNNPSGEIARQCGLPHAVLPVSFAAVESFVAEFPANSYDGIVMLGVSELLGEMQREMVAHNRVIQVPDVDGKLWQNAEIVPDGAEQIQTNLWEPGEDFGPDITTSDDAGGYLCNFIYYKMRLAHPGLATGFLHVPMPAALPLPIQRQMFARVVSGLRAR